MSFVMVLCAIRELICDLLTSIVMSGKEYRGAAAVRN